MNSLTQGVRGNHHALSGASTRFISSYGRSPVFRRLSSSAQLLRSPNGDSRLTFAPVLPTLQPSPLRSRFLPEDIRSLGCAAPQSRLLHTTPQRQQRPNDERQTAEAKTTEDPAAKVDDAQAKEAESGANTDSAAKDQEKKQEGEEKEEKKDEKKEEPPPPPPHGDKTPWQVFMETMDSEFKQSKEWHEGTKALASSAHQFSENESVKKARHAYEATSGAVSSTASTVVKSTAGAIGKGATWTWDTPVMKGVRKAANVTGDAVEKATRPIRETEAYKNVKDVIDDGSSSRYGGWMEKEERRKQRALRVQKARQDGDNPTEVYQEDPE
jgi:mitochondrial import inner membrane translocase subunit TIM44